MKTKTTRRPMKSRLPSTSATPKKLVRIAGLEPARLAALPPQSSVSANSTISASRLELKQLAARKQVDSGRFAPVGAICTPLPERGAPAPREPTQAENPQSRSSAFLTLRPILDSWRRFVVAVPRCAQAAAGCKIHRPQFVRYPFVE